MSDMDVGSAYWHQQQTINRLHQHVATLTAELAQYKPLCLLCGRETPCMTNEDGIANGGPGRPCTFDPTPKEMVERIKVLQRDKVIAATLMNQASEKLEELRAQLHTAQRDTAEKLSIALSMALRIKGFDGVNKIVQEVIMQCYQI